MSKLNDSNNISKQSNINSYIEPPIEFLEKLHEMNPQYLEQFLQDSREAQQHLQKMEEKRITHDFYSTLIGNTFGIVVIALILFFIYGMAVAGHKDVATGTVIAAIATIAALFIYSKKK